MLALVVAFTALRVPVLQIIAQAEGPVVTVDVPALLMSFLALAGFAALSAALINAGKFAGIIADGQAPNASLVLNVLGFALLVIVRVFRPDFDVAGADAILATVATILTSVLGLLTQFGVSKLTNNGIKGLPVIGFSYSRKKAEQLEAVARPAGYTSPNRPGRN